MLEHCWLPVCADATAGMSASAKAEHMPQTSQRDSSFIGMPLPVNRVRREGKVRVARSVRKAQVPESCIRMRRHRSNVEIADPQRVGFDEIPTRLHDIAHQGREDLVGFQRVFDPYLQQTTGIR